MLYKRDSSVDSFHTAESRDNTRRDRVAGGGGEERIGSESRDNKRRSNVVGGGGVFEEDQPDSFGFYEGYYFNRDLLDS
jgi:hypothetical protein